VEQGAKVFLVLFFKKELLPSHLMYHIAWVSSVGFYPLEHDRFTMTRLRRNLAADLSPGGFG